LVLAFSAIASHAGAGDESRLDAVVAKVGAVSITVGDVERRARAMPDFQLTALGSSIDDVRRRVLDQLVEENVFAEAARARKLEQSPPIREKIYDALRVARIGKLRDETTVSADEIAAFYQSNRARFDMPPRINVFRILSATRADAEAVLAQARHADLAQWNQLARERSIDKTSSLRGGNLGFIAADGSSSEVTIKVDPALFAAALRVKDGEFVPEPVAEGAQFAVVWRRGSVPAVHRSLEQESSAIRQIVMRQKLTDGLHALLERLRSEANIEKTPQLIDVLEVTSSGEVAPRKRPGLVEQKPKALPEPTMTPRGLR
jgi:peptidyl-prolyl cis-trans isomerase C